MDNLGRGRIDVLDAWRGLAVVVMVGWHFAWDLALWGYFPQRVMFGTAATLARYFIVFSFVLLSGFSCRLSRSNLRRGAVTLGCAAAVTLVTCLAGDPAWFGILHLLGCCMLLYVPLGRCVERHSAMAAALCLALFALTFSVPDRVRVTTTWLWAFGLRTREFYSSDYYPLIPWAFLFFFGAAAGKWVIAARDKLLKLPAPAALCWVGRHAMAIYLVHQLVLFGLLFLATGRTPF